MLGRDKLMTKVKSTVKGESYTYEILWACCLRQQSLAEEVESGNMYFYLTAMSMAYFAYEAYLNHALHKVAPEIYEKERTYFADKDYYGTPGKLKKLCELADIDFPYSSIRPYQSIKKLQILRDSVAHGKPDPFELTIKHKEGDNPSIVRSSFEELVSPKNSKICISDLKDFILWLNSSLVNKFGNEGLIKHPLNGFLGHSYADFVNES
jgi:hypothetical protein